MTTKHKRVIGTTSEAIAKAEADIGFVFAPSFRAWLLTSNGLSVEGVSIFPVFDERDVRKTWDSIVKQFDSGNWFPEWLEDEGIKSEHLLPFSCCADYYCFDYSRKREDGEVPIVWLSHETGEIEERACSFAEFIEKVKVGEIED